MGCFGLAEHLHRHPSFIFVKHFSPADHHPVFIPIDLKLLPLHLAILGGSVCSWLSWVAVFAAAPASCTPAFSLRFPLMIKGQTSFLCPTLQHEKHKELIPSYWMDRTFFPICTPLIKGLSKLTCLHSLANLPLAPMAVFELIRNTGPTTFPILRRISWS